MLDTMSKDPTAKLPFSRDWAAWCLNEDADTILTSEWVAVTEGITVNPPGKPPSSVTANKATVWVSGGTHGSTYKVKNIITTVGLREDERTIMIIVYDR